MLKWLFHLLLFVQFILAQDYYSILGISKGASDKEIKSAYRSLSKKYHPDKNPGDEEAHQKFIEVGEAYEILGDAEKKRQYDQLGHENFKNRGPGGGQPPPGHGGFQDPFDMFNRMFQGGGGPGGPFGGPRRGQSIKVQQPVSLRQYFEGTVVEFTIPLNDNCDHCKATGSEDGKSKKCPDCNGTGVIIQIIRMGMMTQQIQQPCGRCQGKGHVIKNPCKVCHGARVAKKDKNFKIVLPSGAERHFVDVQHGQAEKAPGIQPGDLATEFVEVPNGNMGYRRRGIHLYRTEYISLQEALKGGWQIELDFFDPKKKVILKRSQNIITKDGEIERIKGFGMPIKGKKGKFGDLFIEWKVIFPKKASHLLDEL